MTYIISCAFFAFLALSAAAQGTDSITTMDGKKAVADIGRDDVMNMTYDDLIALPFEVLVMIAEKLEISVEDLLNMKMTVASKSAMTIREQPGIISVITEDDIKYMGARDLVDVLRLVPGFYFGLDVNGVTGIGMRGNWGHEGKVLMLMDGQEMNDLIYYIYPYGSHFPVEQIKRIEIIRGPGSSLYGGAAELGVINIITKHGGDINGLHVDATIGKFQDMIGEMGKSSVFNIHMPFERNRLNISLGEKFKDIEFVLHGTVSHATRTDKTIQSYYFLDDDFHQGLLESHFGKDGTGELPAANLNMGLKWRGFTARTIYDFYKTWGFDATIYGNVYKHFFNEIKYDLPVIKDKLTLTPSWKFKRMHSWMNEKDIDDQEYTRNIGNLSFIYDPRHEFNITGGVEGYFDRFTYTFQDTGYIDNWGDPVVNTYYNDESSIHFWNFAGFLQGLYKSPFGMNATLGGRYEHNSQYGYAFAPRFGVTQILGDAHAKLLVSKAFRSPSIGSLTLPFDESTASDPQIKPEQTWVEELEVGYRLSKNLFLTGNIFNMDMYDPICYFDIGDAWGYANMPARTGSWGAEIEAAYKSNAYNITANYAFYSNRWKDPVSLLDPNNNELVPFNVPNLTGPYLGAPQHKVGVYGRFSPVKSLWIAPSFVFMSKTSGYLKIDGFDTTITPTEPDTIYREGSTDIVLHGATLDTITTGADTVIVFPESPYDTSVSSIPKISSIGPRLIMNLSIMYENFPIRGMDVSFGIYDVFNTQYPFVQPYNGKGAPYPGPSREFLLKLSYHLPVVK